MRFELLSGVLFRVDLDDLIKSVHLGFHHKVMALRVNQEQSNHNRAT